MSESLGQGYSLVDDYVLPHLRPLVEIYSFHSSDNHLHQRR